MPLPAIVGAVLVAGGLMLLARAFRGRTRRLALLADAVRVTGRVVRHEDASTEGDIHTMSIPVVAYQAPDGRTRELKLPPMRDTSAHQFGAKVPVFYHRADPANAAAVRRTWDVNLACAAAFLVVLAGVGVFFTRYQELRDAATAPPTSQPSGRTR